jgi:hypothetical protein
MYDVPEWLGTGILAAGLAALGFAAKTVFELWSTVLANRRERYAKLIQLRPLLRASWVSFAVQCDWRNQLFDSFVAKYPELKRDHSGYEAIFERCYPHMDDKERSLHAQIRNVTIHYMRPVNMSLLEWVQGDKYFKGQVVGRYRHLAEPLADLEVHLLTWIAHYNEWIPDQPAHALVYVGDELKRGVPFPDGIDKIVDAALGRKSRAARR